MQRGHGVKGHGGTDNGHGNGELTEATNGSDQEVGGKGGGIEIMQPLKHDDRWTTIEAGSKHPSIVTTRRKSKDASAEWVDGEGVLYA